MAAWAQNHIHCYSLSNAMGNRATSMSNSIAVPVRTVRRKRRHDCATSRSDMEYSGTRIKGVFGRSRFSGMKGSPSADSSSV